MSNESKGVSNCYVFKSRLQEYAQKVGFSTPVYETIKEGPSHQPFFKSTVVVNDVRYDSLPGFSNRKAAEQSAAEIALMELVKSGDMKECISQPVHETGLCKNLLQEYAQKMNYAMPAYECQRQDTAGRAAHFSCTVEIGGIRYIGAVARTKKEAEIKAARTALLAIQSSPGEVGEIPNEEIRYTVVPSKRKEPETRTGEQDAAKARKPTKGRFKRKPPKNRQRSGEGDQSQYRGVGPMPSDLGGRATGVPCGDGLLNTPMPDYITLVMDPTRTLDGLPTADHNHTDPLSLEGMAAPNVGISDCQPIPMNPAPVQDGILNISHQHEGSSTLQDGSIPFGNGFPNCQVSECQPVSVAAAVAIHNQSNEDGSSDPNSLQTSDIVGCVVRPIPMNPAPVQDGISNISHRHEGSSTLQGGSIPSGNGFSNGQVSECQPASVVATGAIHNPTLNQSNEDGSPDPNPMQTSDVVGCGVQASPPSQSNVSNSQQYHNGGSSGPDYSSAPLSDSSPLVSSDGFSNSQVSEFQPLSAGATGAVQIDKPDANDTLKDVSSEVSAVSPVNNTDSVQKSDAVKQPEGDGDGFLNGQVSVTKSDFVQNGNGDANDSSVAVEQVGSGIAPDRIETAASSASHVGE